MKARVERDALRTALKAVLPATQTRSAQLPILSCVRIAILEDSEMRLTTTDLDLTIRVAIPASATTEGMVAVPARLFAAVLDKAPDGAVEMCLASGRLDVTAGEMAASLNTLNVDEWPRTIEPPKKMFELTPDQVAAIKRVLPAVSTDMKRPTICTVHFKGDRVEATDSYRAMVATLDGLDLPEAMVSGTAVASALKYAGPPVRIAINDRTVTIATDTASWTMRTTEGDYPPLDRLFPAAGESTLAIPAERLLRAIDVAQAVSQAPVLLTRDGDRLVVSATDVEQGHIEDVVEGCSGDFEGELKFNPQILREAIEGDGCSTVTLQPSGLKPTLIQSDGFRQVLVPIRSGVK